MLVVQEEITGIQFSWLSFFIFYDFAMGESKTKKETNRFVQVSNCHVSHQLIEKFPITKKEVTAEMKTLYYILACFFYGGFGLESDN